MPPYPSHPHERCYLSPDVDPDTGALVEAARREYGLGDGVVGRTGVGDEGGSIIGRLFALWSSLRGLGE